jgi:hypothetical protein
MTKCKFCNECKNQQLLWDLYASITKNVKKTNGYYGNYMQVLQGMQNVNGYYWTYMRVLQWMQNACDYFRTYVWVLHIWKSPYGIYNRKWCKYYMFKMCVFFKKSSGDVSPIILDVSTAQCSFWSLVWFLHLKY